MIKDILFRLKWASEVKIPGKTFSFWDHQCTGVYNIKVLKSTSMELAWSFYINKAYSTVVLNHSCLDYTLIGGIYLFNNTVWYIVL